MESDNNSLKEKKILLVDDTPANLDILRRTLVDEGYEISTASSGEAALKVVSRIPPDLILLDIMMPGIDGMETCRRLKENKETREIPVIFITAKTGTEDMVQGFSLGAVDYIPKPFRREEVLVRVRNHLRLRDLIKKEEKAREEIGRYARELKRSNKDLEDFAAIASHDLQEPLRKVMAFGERLESILGENLEDRGRDCLQRIRKATTRMQNFIDDLLEFSRVNIKGKPFVTTDLKKVAEEVLGDLETRLARSGGTVNIESLPTVEADPFQMRQLLLNLIGNALKFQRKDVPPVVRLSKIPQENGTVKFVVEDNGIGFDDTKADRIFKPFERLHGKSEYEGSGMGLAICKKIVMRHGGAIAVKSQINKGTLFEIALPEKQAKKE